MYGVTNVEPIDVADKIRLGFELFNRRDWDTLARGLPDDFEAIDRVPPDELRVSGPDALRTITTANGDTAFSGFQMNATEIELVQGDGGTVHAVVRVVAEGSGGTSNAPVRAEIGQVWTYEDGVPRRFEQYRTWEDARAAVGA